MTIAVGLVAQTCCNCSVAFGLSEEMYAERKRDRRIFWCPNGHQQHFIGETEAQRLRRELEVERANTTYYRETLDQEVQRHRSTKRNLTRTRNERDRIKALIANGVCPFGCKRHFANVARHMATKHSGETVSR